MNGIVLCILILETMQAIVQVPFAITLILEDKINSSTEEGSFNSTFSSCREEPLIMEWSCETDNHFNYKSYFSIYGDIETTIRHLEKNPETTAESR